MPHDPMMLLASDAAGTESAPVTAEPRLGQRVLRFDRRFGEIGIARLQRSSETRDRARFAELNALLTTLAATDDGAEILRAFAADDLTVDELACAANPTTRKFILSECRQKATVRSTASVTEASAVALTTSCPAGAPSPPPGSPVGVPTVSVTLIEHVHGPQPCDIQRVEAPFWTTALECIHSKSIKPTSKRRYKTSLDALHRKAATFALPAAVREELAGLSDAEWDALGTLLSRRIPTEALMHLATLSPPAQAQLLRNLNVRIGTGTLARIAGISRPEWEAVCATRDCAIHPKAFEILDGLSEAEDAELTRFGTALGPTATFVDVARVSAEQWDVLRKHWGAGSADWNHVRRMLSAVFTVQLPSSTGNELRRIMMKRIKGRKETWRQCDLTPAVFWSIVAHMPEHLQSAIVTLAATGLRVGEYELLERGHLQPATYMINVPGTKTAASDNQIAVAPALWEYVDRAVPAYARYSWLRRAFRSACEAAGVERGAVTLHDLRHCHAQWAMNHGALEPEVQAQLRHESADTTRRYTYTRARERVAAAASVAILGGCP